VVIGHSSGDVTFPDDERVSELHALLKREGERARLEDAGSTNGTWVRLRGERELHAGDTLRLGDHTLRFER
jgi:pSer/pThr/pTyr-binding forkhead associated (FHA) protein